MVPNMGAIFLRRLRDMIPPTSVETDGDRSDQAGRGGTGCSGRAQLHGRAGAFSDGKFYGIEFILGR